MHQARHVYPVCTHNSTKYGEPKRDVASLKKHIAKTFKFRADGVFVVFLEIPLLQFEASLRWSSGKGRDRSGRVVLRLALF